MTKKGGKKNRKKRDEREMDRRRKERGEKRMDERRNE
jgi:hypothetical protein